MLTDTQLTRLNNDFNKYAKETVEVEQVCTTVYAFGSELATLRILAKYHNSDRVEQGYSENLKTFYFRLELSK